MPNTREKLIELFQHDDCPLFMVFGELEQLADYLIASGVTISNLETVNKEWIPVTERLPTEIEEFYQQYGKYPEFIVMLKGGLVPTTLYFDGEGWFDEANEFYGVTHWMPMPLPPKGDCE